MGVRDPRFDMTRGALLQYARPTAGPWEEGGILQEWSVAQVQREWDDWSLPTLMLWGVFFLVGLDPEVLFYRLRMAGEVVSQRALVNSPALVTLSFAAYFAYFGYRRCLEGGSSHGAAQARAMQLGILGLTGFLWYSVRDLAGTREMGILYYRMITYVTVAAKFAAWAYLGTLVMRYYALGNRRVFAEMFCVFPSGRKEDPGPPGGEAGA